MKQNANAHPSRWRVILLLSLGLIFVELAWLSVAQFRGYNTRAFDLGTISQAIGSVWDGKALIYTHKGLPLSRLSEHVEVIYFLLAPFYAIWPSPETLLLIQAGLFSLGAWPVYRLALRRLQNPKAALWLAGVYLLYPVAQTAVLFEFHGDTIGMPLLMFAIEALDRRAKREYAVWIMLALLSKFYVAIPVAALGAYTWWRGEKKWGVVTAVSAIIWGGIAFFLIRRLFAPPELADTVKATASGYLGFYFGRLLEITPTLLLRLANGFVVYTPIILLGRRAPGWLLVAGSIIFPVFVSTGPGPSFNYIFHHYALSVPFLIAAAIYGAEHAKKKDASGRNWVTAVRFTFFITLIINLAAVN
ncbi:MAG: DUF2079 domain-containing protein, partial [Chloroflexi bacterium]|nr:DUF2079 domain-containing protein [Chloroflexota bacterium]